MKRREKKEQKAGRGEVLEYRTVVDLKLAEGIGEDAEEEEVRKHDLEGQLLKHRSVRITVTGTCSQ